ncbi:MAG: STAS domain-containing protein [Chloroflexales bacterium]|nr:STAS domain-containing protein [Chloroflexales bacterium]
MSTPKRRWSPTSLTLRWRLMLAMGLLAALVAAIALASVIGLARVRSTATAAVEVDGLMSQLASAVAIKAQATRRYDQSFFLHLEEPAQREAFRAMWSKAEAELDQAISEFAAAATEAEDQRQARLWQAAYVLYTEGFRNVVADVESGELTSPRAADARLETYHQNIETLNELSDDFAARKRAKAQAAAADLASTTSLIMITLAGLGGLAVLVAVGWSLSFPARLTRPLAALSAAARRLAAGDLGVRTGVTGGDEIGALGMAFDQMAATIEQRTSDLQAQFAAAEAARCEAEAAQAKVAEQLATIAAQRSAILEMSVPILPVAEGVLVLPLVGALDSARIAQAQERALQAVEESRASFVIIDITGVPVVDTQVARGLIELIQAAHMLGARAVLVGIRPEVAQTIVGLGIDLGAMVTRGTLQGGVSYTTQATNGAQHKGLRR